MESSFKCEIDIPAELNKNNYTIERKREWNNIDTLELRRHKQRRNMYTQSSQKPKKANRLKIYACQTFRKVGYEMP